MNSILLSVNQIHKEYNTVKAIDGLSFQVKKGEIFSLLGPNGAGKTTTVRTLTNIILPDEGTISYHLNGSTSSSLPADKIGYLPEERGLYPDLKILYTLSYFGILHGMKKADATKSAKNWLDKMGLLDRANEKLDSLSKGNQQKVQFIASILHSPQFAILDEPFSGLDPVNQEFFLELITELKNKGMTILLSAHQMQMVERIADRLLLINKGREVLNGTLSEIRDQHHVDKKVSLKFSDPVGREAFANLDFSDRITVHSDIDIELSTSKDENLSDMLSQIAKLGKISDINTEQITLHDIFIHTVNDQNKSGE